MPFTAGLTGNDYALKVKEMVCEEAFSEVTLEMLSRLLSEHVFAGGTQVSWNNERAAKETISALVRSTPSLIKRDCLKLLIRHGYDWSSQVLFKQLDGQEKMMSSMHYLLEDKVMSAPLCWHYIEVFLDEKLPCLQNADNYHKALCSAVIFGQVDIARKALNVITPDGFSKVDAFPLAYHAVKNNNKRMLQLLHRWGINMSVAKTLDTQLSETPAVLAQRMGQLDFVAIIKSRPSDEKSLCIRVQENAPTVLIDVGMMLKDRLIEGEFSVKIADPAAEDQSEEAQAGFTALQWALKNENKELFQLIAFYMCPKESLEVGLEVEEPRNRALLSMGQEKWGADFQLLQNQLEVDSMLEAKVQAIATAKAELARQDAEAKAELARQNAERLEMEHRTKLLGAGMIINLQPVFMELLKYLISKKREGTTFESKCDDFAHLLASILCSDCSYDLKNPPIFFRAQKTAETALFAKPPEKKSRDYVAARAGLLGQVKAAGESKDGVTAELLQKACAHFIKNNSKDDTFTHIIDKINKVLIGHNCKITETGEIKFRKCPHEPEDCLL